MTRGLLIFLSRTTLHFMVVTVAIIWLLPTAGLLITSFRPPQDVARSGWWTVFQTPFDFTQFTLKNYESVITRAGLGRAFVNSLFIAVPATLLPVLLASFAAYAFAWMDFTGRDQILVVVVGLLVVPLQMTFIPVLRVFRILNLAGTFPAIWLAHTGYGLPLTIYLLHNFIVALPRDLFDSAAIDGASTIQIFFRIVIPLSVPAIACIVIFQFLWVWNDLLVALIYLGGAPNVVPITLKLANLVGARGQDWQLLTAAAFISMVLPLMVFFFMQRHFVRGILAGSIRG